jgi:hypothetical protein
MDRTSDFVRLGDILDPDRDAVRATEVDCAGNGRGFGRRSVVTLICIAGIIVLAALQPHARHVSAPGPHEGAAATVQH